MASIQILVALGMLALACGSPVEPQLDTVWLLSVNYTSYAYSPIKDRLLALHPGGLAVDELDLATRTVAKTYPMPIPGYRISIGKTGRYVSVVHNSYITFIDVVAETLQTENFPYADVPVDGLVVDLTEEHETCAWIHFRQGGGYVGEIVCVNPVNGNATKCYQAGAYGYTTTTLGTSDGKCVYGLTSSGYIAKYRVPDVTRSPIATPRCPYFLRSVVPNWGNYYTPNSAWFSYDNSRIFLNNGLTLSASSDQTEDLQEHGAFNGSFYEQYIYWVDQDRKLTTHPVVALQRIYARGEFKLHVIKYSWPYLKAMGSPIDIPVPTSPADLKVATHGFGSQVYFGTSSSTVMAVVNYTMDDLIHAPGVAYINL
ncbi:uncharacterized protein LOC135829407 [Sycon ciliatum]|uniref:uncharacterized protein LOC135829407 n=1 Tax=Sycon ciliatum TaxID=27933 RepID=UPI0031F6590F